MKASLPLQMAIWFNRFYSAAFFVVMLLIFIYKGERERGEGPNRNTSPDNRRRFVFASRRAPFFKLTHANSPPVFTPTLQV